jgi:hypothetical protein
MQHVALTCENHPNLRWSCKGIAVDSDGRYNGARNIFFFGGVRTDGSSVSVYDPETNTVFSECSCPGSKLIALTD